MHDRRSPSVHSHHIGSPEGPTPDELEELRRRMEGDVLRAAAYSRRAYVRDGVLVLEGGRADEWAHRIARWNQVVPGRGYSVAAFVWREILSRRRYAPRIAMPHAREG